MRHSTDSNCNNGSNDGYINTNEDLLDTISFDKFITELTGMSYSDFQKEFGNYGDNKNDNKGNLE
jgi:hypothetical protein